MVRAPVNIDKIPAGPELNALVAERVMGWKELKRQSDRYWGKRKDRAGRWRRAAVQDYSRAPAMAYLVEQRMKELGLVKVYEKELERIAGAQKLPAGWAAPDQRCRAALKAVRSSKVRCVK